MSNLQKTTRLFAFLALAVILVGCSTPTLVVEPTPDLPRIRTESAQTVVAKITIEAALNPTATSTPAQPTATTAPTDTPTQDLSAPTSTLVSTLTSVPTLKPVTGGGGVVYPTATVRAGPDQAQYISQTPYDGTVFHPGESFDATWTFKNVGTSTWKQGIYYIRWAKEGTNMSPTDKYMLNEDVKPGESHTFVADMVAPPTGGRYVSYWQLVNDNGATFYQFYVVIDVK
jgi:hypothetical protein